MSKHVGAVRAKDAQVSPVGAFVEGELYLSWMHFFQAHSCLYSFLALFFYLFFFFFFFYSRTNQGTLPWHGDQS
jgi:hypothetical protein